MKKIELIKNKLTDSYLDSYILDKLNYMFLDNYKFNKKNFEYINEYRKFIDSFLNQFIKVLEKTVDQNKIDKFIKRNWNEIFLGLPNIKIDGNSLNYCYEKIDSYLYEKERTIFNIEKMNWNNSSSTNEEWGLRCLYIFYYFFAKKYVYMDLNKMSFNELYLLVHVANFRHRHKTINEY